MHQATTMLLISIDHKTGDIGVVSAFPPHRRSLPNHGLFQYATGSLAGDSVLYPWRTLYRIGLRSVGTLFEDKLEPWDAAVSALPLCGAARARREMMGGQHYLKKKIEQYNTQLWIK